MTLLTIEALFAGAVAGALLAVGEASGGGLYSAAMFLGWCIVSGAWLAWRTYAAVANDR